MKAISRARRAATRDLIRSAAAVSTLLACTGTYAQDSFPTRPIRLVVPYAPGGTTDQIGRVYAEALARIVGQPVIVENRPGASTNIAAEVVARAEPDGYTLLLATNQLIINTIHGPVPAIDPMTAFSPVGMLAEIPFMVAVGAQSSIGSAQGLARAAATRSPTIASAQFDPQVKLLSLALGVPLTAVPYKGGAQAASDAIGGQVDAVMSAVPALAALIKAGRLRAIGVASTSRIAGLPDVPTFAEQGFPKFVHVAWASVLAPKGTADAVLRKLSAATASVAKDAAYGERLAGMGAQALSASSAETQARFKAERDTWLETAR